MRKSRQTNVFTGTDNQSSSNEKRILAAFNHTSQPVDGGIVIGTADRLVQGRYTVVMFLS